MSTGCTRKSAVPAPVRTNPSTFWEQRKCALWYETSIDPADAETSMLSGGAPGSSGEPLHSACAKLAVDLAVSQAAGRSLPSLLSEHPERRSAVIVSARVGIGMSEVWDAPRVTAIRHVPVNWRT